MDEQYNLIGEMILAIVSADGRITRDELREVQRVAPKFIDKFDERWFSDFFNNFPRKPDWYDCARALNDNLSSDEKNNYYELLEFIAKSDELEHVEEIMLQRLKSIWEME
jgi:uncharacterized tellurite resistance protein B-like protein